ncbi:MAG: hypothetical protein HY709_06230 [Candidatus Latescibacteria bacterium]|nr:hypothetical protein [Candidatus Latescibacterota bacterium]
MRKRDLSGFSQVFVAVLTCTILTGRALALEVWVIGNKERPWKDMGLLENVDVDARSGRLQPFQVSIHENLAVGARARGGGIDSPQPSVRSQGDLSRMIDGNSSTAFEGGQIPLIRGDILLDLGATFTGVRKVRFYPSPGFNDRFLRSYELYANGGGPEQGLDENLVWQLVDKRDDNTESDVQIEIPPQDIRYILLRYTTPLTWEIAELEVYGQGYVREGTYTSNVIDFGGVANFSNLKWSAEIDPGASITVMTRSGDTMEPYKYYRRRLKGLQQGGYEIVKEEVTKEEFERLNENDRMREVDTEYWSPWSAPYSLSSGEPIHSPSPRRYFQFTLRFLSTSFESGVRVDSLSFEVSRPPVAHEVVAEISPRSVQGGDPTTFTYAVRPRIEGRDTGFDALEVMTPSRVTAIRDLRIGDVAVKDFSYQIEDDRFVIFFPDQRVVKNGTLLTLSFDCQVVIYGTRFTGNVFDSKTVELPQEIVPGDATHDLDTDDLSVAVSLEEEVVAIVDISPNPFTPNGDQRNDVTVITYRLLKLLKSVATSGFIYDMSGTLVREFPSDGTQENGVYQMLWDGRDMNGAPVPPGMYVCRISAPVQAKRDVATGVIVVIY